MAGAFAGMIREANPMSPPRKFRFRKTGAVYDLSAERHQWGLPSKFDSNPLIWMLTVNGMMVDIRQLPIDLQEAAYRKRLIPYVPGAKHS
jgi:hypothetical protein